MTHHCMNNNHLITILQNFQKPEASFLQDKECLICLESFDLESNKIQSAQGLEDLIHLTYLDLDSNKIQYTLVFALQFSGFIYNSFIISLKQMIIFSQFKILKIRCSVF